MVLLMAIISSIAMWFITVFATTKLVLWIIKNDKK